ncbi:MAG: valine--tRNA ligase [Cytophagales bacterium]|nr:valine--tRNA ligase [Bernardetiaceae bacterium]MDW8211178.1 valine--tRNA ligase [Cytophagales bacterium]
MSSIPKTYNPQEIESKWYSRWMQEGFFRSVPNPDKKRYCIVIPPPNVTGVLHMGHILNNTIQDVLVRRARMRGFETCWVPGTDHASIATEAKVVKMLKEKGIDKRSLTRQEFLRYAWEWKEKYGGIILEQLKKLGASCDWERTRFTMEPKLSQQVLQMFVDLYRDGYIYRGLRMVNWDPQGRTALSDEEVIHRPTQSKLYYVRYKIVGEEGYIVVATQRPETIMGDVAVAVNPQDERYRHLHGKKVIVPIVERVVPVIADDYVDMEFGTGCLKITPAHDANDYQIGQRHQLPIIDTLNEDGTFNAHAFKDEQERQRVLQYDKIDRFQLRTLIAERLQVLGQLERIDENYVANIGYSERTEAVVEPRLSIQWFVRMKELCQPALENVMNDNIRLHPPKFKNIYRHWIENIRDWCISRQLWWGHRIPAWYINGVDYSTPASDDLIAVCLTAEEALEQLQQKATIHNSTHISKVPCPQTLDHIRQDEDVLDTWFSSGLWPISVFDGVLDPNNKDITYYYPTDDLVTAPEILFFWVMRMIITGYYYRKEKPFKNVYLTGIVRDKIGRKMSKSLGNSPDALELMAKYSADGVRAGMLFSSPAGNDLLFDEKLCEQGRNFANKIWNAFRLVKGWSVDEALPVSPVSQMANKWFEAKLQAAIAEMEDCYEKYRISDALLIIYRLIWEDFCSWYLEMIKPEHGKPIELVTFETAIYFFETLLKLLHPFMPFITEEIWHGLRQRQGKDYLIVASYPTFQPLSPEQKSMLEQTERIFQIIQQVRALRNQKKIAPKEALPLAIKTHQPALYQRFEAMMKKLAHLSKVVYLLEELQGNVVRFVVEGDEFFVSLSNLVDGHQELKKLQAELEYQQGFLESVEKKLSNQKFLANAKPEVVENERRKQADAQARIAALQSAIAALQQSLEKTLSQA